MIPLLIALTVVEILLVVAVLAVYLVKIAQSLQNTIGYLGKVSFGVRAIETQVETVGPSVVRINDQLDAIAAELAELERLAAQRRPG
jgi:predicted PurR-regulated permease PerM